MSSNQRLNRWLPFIFLCILVALLVPLAWFLRQPLDPETAGTTASVAESETSASSKPPAPTPVPDLSAQLTLAVGGDVLMHDPVLKGGLTDDGRYDYKYSFAYIQEYLQEADYAVLNMEGTLAGEPYHGWPLFSAPDEVAEAMVWAGTDAAIVANNHILDRGLEGMDRTLEVLQEAGLATIGVSRDETSSSWLLQDINGSKVGFSAWTWETIRQGDDLALKGLNGLVIPEAALGRLDSFSLQESPDFMSEDIRKVTARVAEMRAEGAELVVFFMHWGLEYDNEEDRFAEHYVQALADASCDLVIGSGPHVVQPIREIRSSDGSHRMLCYYSVGNLISDQGYDTGNAAGHAEDGLLAVVSYERSPSGELSLKQADYLATYCSKRLQSKDGSHNTIIPVAAALQDPAAYNMEDRIDQLSASLARTEAVMARNTLELPSRSLTFATASP